MKTKILVPESSFYENEESGFPTWDLICSISMFEENKLIIPGKHTLNYLLDKHTGIQVFGTMEDLLSYCDEATKIAPFIYGTFETEPIK